MTVSVTTPGAATSHDCSTRCGFRDFRLENGYFRLNGKRIFLKSSHSGFEMPVGMTVPLDPDFIRRDVLNCKTMGMNMIRSFNGLAPRRLLDFCDALGFLVDQENYFHQCLAWMAGLRKLGVNAIRSNPNVIGHSVTGTQNQGLTTNCRRPESRR